MPTPNNPLKDYDNIAENSLIRFLSGSQAALNTMMENGTAAEGTFYLTNDTHKLYVGRKKTADGKVYPEQVSRGVTVVGNSDELPTPNPTTPAVEGAIEEGELFYITDSNVLAALRKKVESDRVTYEWVQVNPPTGITRVSTSADTSNNTATVITNITTAAGNQSGSFKIAGGDNITLTSSNDTNNRIGTVTINATDTEYSAGTAATAENQTNGATIGLKKNDETTLDSSITISGSNTVAVTSTVDGTVNVVGPTFNRISVNGKTDSATGMTISIDGYKGDGTNLNLSGDVDPIIEYGNGTKSAAHFQRVTRSNNNYIIADLDVYTKDQADTAITNAITSQLATANAMTYKGVVTQFSDLIGQIEANGGAHNGDVYKVGSINQTFQVNGVTVDTGDLIILTGEEATSGNYAGQILINGQPVDDDTSSGSILGSKDNPGICELIPSGDEPELTASIYLQALGDNSETTAPNLTLYDGKNNGSPSSTNILTTRFLSGNKIIVKGEATSDTNKRLTGQDLKLTFDHETISRTDDPDVTVQNNGTANAVLTKAATGAIDTIGQDGYELFVFSDPGKALTTDNYGHVTGFNGKKIVFKHNKINNPVISYGNHATDSNHAIVGISISDSIGNTASANLDVKSSTLAVSGDSTNNRLTVDLKWQTF